MLWQLRGGMRDRGNHVRLMFPEDEWPVCCFKQQQLYCVFRLIVSGLLWRCRSSQTRVSVLDMYTRKDSGPVLLHAMPPCCPGADAGVPRCWPRTVSLRVLFAPKHGSQAPNVHL